MKTIAQRRQAKALYLKERHYDKDESVPMSRKKRTARSRELIGAVQRGRNTEKDLIAPKKPRDIVKKNKEKKKEISDKQFKHYERSNRSNESWASQFRESVKLPIKSRSKRE